MKRIIWGIWGGPVCRENHTQRHSHSRQTSEAQEAVAAEVTLSKPTTRAAVKTTERTLLTGRKKERRKTQLNRGAARNWGYLRHEMPPGQRVLWVTGENSSTHVWKQAITIWVWAAGAPRQEKRTSPHLHLSGESYHSSVIQSWPNKSKNYTFGCAWVVLLMR